MGGSGVSGVGEEMPNHSGSWISSSPSASEPLVAAKAKQTGLLHFVFAAEMTLKVRRKGCFTDMYLSDR